MVSMWFVIVVPAPTTAIVAKYVFNKYLSHERRKISQEPENTALTHLFVQVLKCIPNNLERKQKEKLMNGTYKAFMKGLVGN